MTEPSIVITILRTGPSLTVLRVERGGRSLIAFSEPAVTLSALCESFSDQTLWETTAPVEVQQAEQPATAEIEAASAFCPGLTPATA